MNTKPILIVINGRPASGKSTLAKRLSNDLSIPHFYKDEIKEVLFDTLGYSDREWSTKCNAPSFALMYLIAIKLLAVGASVIIEGNFSPKYDLEKIIKIIEDTKCRIVQVVCSADKEILFERFKERANSGIRHSGHNDDKDLEQAYERHFSSDYINLDLSGELIVYDTTEQNEIKYQTLLKTIQQLVKDD